MRQMLIIVGLGLVATPAMARPGFYVGLGLGGSSVHGPVVQPIDLTAPNAQWLGSNLTTDIDGGFSLLVTMGFNILGYAAIETRAIGLGHDLDNANEREWAAHWHTGVRAYPMWHWQDRLPELLQPLEPSLFLGWGLAYQGNPLGIDDEVAWRTWNSWRFGAALEYFIVTYFKVGLDYSYVHAPHDLLIYDLDTSTNFNINPHATTGFHQFYVTAIFQFDPKK